jgi:dTDP-4-dehydrorhamnose 3,5-epimerase
MEIEKTTINDCVIIKPKIYNDERGIFFESFKDSNYYTHFPTKGFVQDNISVSKKNVLRGLHFQTGQHAQAKLIRVLSGTVQDVIVDCRINSSTFGTVFSYILDGKKYEQIYIPKGCAHGYLVLQENTIFSYKVDNDYNVESESGIMYNDPDLNIKWFINKNDYIIISAKDSSLPRWKNCYKFKF